LINTENDCLTQELNSAKMQVDFSKDWIYNNFLDLHDSNPDFYRCHIKITVWLFSFIFVLQIAICCYDDPGGTTG